MNNKGTKLCEDPGEIIFQTFGKIQHACLFIESEA